MLLHRLFIDQRRAQQRLEVGRKVQAVTEDGEEDPAGAFRWNGISSGDLR